MVSKETKRLIVIIAATASILATFLLQDPRPETVRINKKEYSKQEKIRLLICLCVAQQYMDWYIFVMQKHSSN